MRLRTARPVAGATGDILVHCPFHTDKTASMSVNINNGIFHCFSCGRSGSIEKLFKECTNENLYKALNISYDEFSKLAIVPPTPIQDIKILDTSSIKIDFNPTSLISCRHSSLAKKFLRKRSIPFSIVDQHSIRFAEKIIINKIRYENVLVVPIYEGNVLISMELRDTTGTAERKVKYPFNSSVNTLYQLDKLDKSQPLFVTEGLMDLLVLRKYPQFKNSTTIFGASVTHRQKALLEEFESVVYIPDNDAAGDKTVQWFIDQKMHNVSILKVPSQINGVAIKDAGDVDAKSGISIKDLLQRKWLAHIRQLTM